MKGRLKENFNFKKKRFQFGYQNIKEVNDFVLKTVSEGVEIAFY